VKYVLQTSGGAAVYTQDNVIAGVTVDPGLCEGRLTLTSGTAVTVSDVTIATTVYWTPSRGNRCALYSTTLSAWLPQTFTERSLSIAGFAANTNYDVFLYDNGGTLTLDATAWSSGTARATALALQDGVYVKAGTLSRRYLGTFRTTATIGQTEDSAARRFVWNHYNRATRPLRRIETTASWTYTIATNRQANGSTANQVDVVIGVAEGRLHLQLQAAVANTNAGVGVNVGIGEDITTGYAPECLTNSLNIIASAQVQPILAVLDKTPAIGNHFYAWVESSQATGTTTWHATSVGAVGLSGFIEG
jgi:hypothetical protein